jgi:hypothetical protein
VAASPASSVSSHQSLEALLHSDGHLIRPQHAPLHARACWCVVRRRNPHSILLPCAICCCSPTTAIVDVALKDIGHWIDSCRRSLFKVDRWQCRCSLGSWWGASLVLIRRTTDVLLKPRTCAASVPSRQSPVLGGDRAAPPPVSRHRKGAGRLPAIRNKNILCLSLAQPLVPTEVSWRSSSRCCYRAIPRSRRCSSRSRSSFSCVLPQQLSHTGEPDGCNTHTEEQQLKECR